jgi:hypothetical protein
VSGSLVPALVIAGLMAVILAVSMLVMSRAGKKAEVRADELRADVEQRGERWVIPLRGANYQGGAPTGARSRGHGVLGLTDRRVLFLPIAGELVAVPRARVTGARTEERRREAAASHRQHLVLTLDDASEVAFLVDDGEKWTAALAPADEHASEAAPVETPGEADPPDA